MKHTPALDDGNEVCIKEGCTNVKAADGLEKSMEGSDASPALEPIQHVGAKTIQRRRVNKDADISKNTEQSGAMNGTPSAAVGETQQETKNPTAEGLNGLCLVTSRELVLLNSMSAIHGAAIVTALSSHDSVHSTQGVLTTLFQGQKEGFTRLGIWSSVAAHAMLRNPTIEANAALICKAVNCHAGLVEALKGMLEVFVDSDQLSDCEDMATVKAARKILAECEKE